MEKVIELLKRKINDCDETEMCLQRFRDEEQNEITKESLKSQQIENAEYKQQLEEAIEVLETVSV